MKTSKFPVLRLLVRVIVASLAMVTGASRATSLGSSPSHRTATEPALPSVVVVPQFGDCYGDGGDICQYTFDCNYFCSCGDGCYYGFYEPYCF